MLAEDQGDYPETERLCQQSLDITERIGDHAGVPATTSELGFLASDLPYDLLRSRRT
jgi:hypothetical protein